MSENPQSVWFWMQSDHENGLTSARWPRSLMSFTCRVINLNQPCHGGARRAVHAARFSSTWRTNPLYNPVSTLGSCWFCCLHLEEFLVASVNCKLAAWSCLQASYCLSCRENPYRRPDVSCSWTKVQHEELFRFPGCGQLPAEECCLQHPKICRKSNRIYSEDPELHLCSYKHVVLWLIPSRCSPEHVDLSW